MIFFYEWALSLKWEGTLLDDEEKVTGVIEVPNLSEENDSESVDVSVVMLAWYGSSDGCFNHCAGGGHYGQVLLCLATTQGDAPSPGTTGRQGEAGELRHESQEW